MTLSTTNYPGVMFRVGKDGKRQYHISFSDENGKPRRKRVHGDQEAARRELETIRAKLRTGSIVSPQSVTLSELWEEWAAIKLPDLRPKTQESYRSSMTGRVLPTLGGVRVQWIDTHRVEQLAAELKKRYTPGTVSTTLAPLRLVLKHGVKKKLITANPFSELDSSSAQQEYEEKRILDRLELERLFEAANPRWMLPLKVAAFCGLRASEVLGLTWRNVDFNGGTLAIRRQAGGETGSEPLKTPASRRTVYVMPALLAALKAHKLASPYSQDDHPVFATEKGGHFKYGSFGGAMKATAERAELGEPRPTLHTLRHGFGSMLIAKGTDIAFVSRQLGHANPGITLSIYTHEWEHGDSAAKATALMESTFAALV